MQSQANHAHDMTQTDSKDDIPNWRPVTSTELDDANRIARRIHSALPERPEVFAEKFNLFPEGCFVLTKKDSVVGYGFSHPWRLHHIPALDAFLGTLPFPHECLFIHDVAILPDARGHATSKIFVETIAGLARQRGISFLALVSVYDTHLLWARYGFEVVSEPALNDKLKSYGPSARYMVLTL
jgi:GNAT superfamily N-acetyltransferase